MTKKIKFITRLLVLTLFSAFISCNEELYDIKDQHNGLDKNKISLSQFKNETNINKIDPILSVRATKSLSSKTKTQLSDFVIDTLAIKKLISENNKTTYTFRIYPLFAVAKPNEIYNLVYRKVNDTWETSIFYLKKFPEENSEHKLFEKIERIDDGKVTHATSSKTTNLQMCPVENTDFHCTCISGECDRCSECVSTSISFILCDSGSGGGTVNPGGTTGTGGTFGGGTVSTGGGNSSSGSYSYSPNYFENPDFETAAYFNKNNTTYVRDNLSEDQQKFFSSNPERNKYFNQTIQYQIDNDWSSESKEIADWARDYKFGNPDVTWAQFQNWFMTPREGKDGDYDAPFWENPNLTFPQQQLPSFQSFDDAYPRTSGADLALLIGGDVLQLYNKYPSVVRGFCALKVSRGLNYSGITIPYIVTTNKNPGTVLGSDGKYYFLNAKALNKWMQKTFGISPSNPNHKKILGPQSGKNGENFPFLTAGIKGIYSMVSTNSEWASGHADLISNGTCIFGCHFYDIPPAPIDYIDIWILN
jgi:hypothetical protein